MATAAGCGRMSTFQFEIRKRVIEGLGIEKDNVGFAALVIRVTSFAFRRRHFRVLAVEPSPFRNIVPDLLMAFEAKPALFLL